VRAAPRAASARISAERLPEVRVIQRLQQVPPRFVFQRTAFSRFAVRRLLPALARAGVLPLVIGFAARRFLFGVSTVRLADGEQTQGVCPPYD
jgi:hypothetical protein